MSDVLKPCPLCEGLATVTSHPASASVKCGTCGCTVQYAHGAYTQHSEKISIANAVSKWNSRPWESELLSALEKVQYELEDVYRGLSYDGYT